MLTSPWWRTPQLLFRSLGAQKAAVLLGGVLGIGIAIFAYLKAPAPAPGPPPSLDQKVAWIRGLAFVEDALIVAIRGGPAADSEMVALQFWDAASGELRAVLPGHAEGILAGAFSPEGRLFASAGYDQTLRVWDVGTGRERATLQRPKTVFHPLAFDPAGGLAWIEEGTVQHWDSIAGTIWAAPERAVGPAVSIAFSPDGRLLATAGSDFTDFATRLWELPAGTLRLALPRGPNAIVCVAFSPDSRVLVTGDWGGAVELWDTGTGQRLRALPGLPAWVRALTFSADGSRLAAGDVQGTVKVWDVATGREQKSFSTAQFLRRQKQRDK